MSSIVTCYYKIKSKHLFEKYDEWIKNLLDNFVGNMIIFTSKNMEGYFSEIISSRKNFKLYFKELDELDILKKYGDIWEYQNKIDPQRDIRTKECYVIWNSKLDFMKEAIGLNPFNSDKFVWSDIGNFRDISKKEYLMNYPVYEKISKDKLDIVKVIDFQEKEYFFNEIHLSGSMFGSGKENLLKIHKLFYELFDEYVKYGRFIGCDQQIMVSLYCRNKELFNLITGDDFKIDKWFYLYYYYS